MAQNAGLEESVFLAALKKEPPLQVFKSSGPLVFRPSGLLPL